MLLFGTGPGLYLDLAAFIFQVPNSDSCVCASRVPASTSTMARLIWIRMVLGFVLSSLTSSVNVCQVPPPEGQRLDHLQGRTVDQSGIAPGRYYHITAAPVPWKYGGHNNRARSYFHLLTHEFRRRAKQKRDS